MKLVRIALALLALSPAAARAQEEKAEIQIMNNRGEPITMRFSYAFRQFKYKLMERIMLPETDLTYRFPARVPGCETLHNWGIADGMLTISNDSGEICAEKVSLCEKSSYLMNVRDTKCQWQQTGFTR